MADSKSELRLVDPATPEASQRPDGAFWDKPSPNGPPTPTERSYPKHLLEVVKFFKEVVADEEVVLELCLDKATAMVEFNIKKRMVGIDMIQDGGQMHPFNLVAAASPLAIELYKNVLASIDQRRDEYEALQKAAQEELRAGKSPTIFTP